MAKESLIFLVIALSVSFHHSALAFPQVNKTKEICLTPTCIHTASRVLKYLDTTVAPCDDFYRFACGNYLKSTAIPAGKKFVSSFLTTHYQMKDSLKLSFEKPNSPDDPHPIKMARNYYKTCINQPAIEKLGLNFFRKVIKYVGGWPILSEKYWNESQFSWLSTFFKLSKIGYSPDYFVNFIIQMDIKNSSSSTIYQEQPNLLNISRKSQDDYEKYMIDILTTFGTSNENLSKDVKNVLEFAFELVDISQNFYDLSLLNIFDYYERVTIAELKANYSSIPWNRVISEMLSSQVPMKDTDIVILPDPNYFDKLQNLLDKTSKKIQANYIVWSVFTSSVQYLTEEIRNKSMKFMDSDVQTEMQKEREIECHLVLEKKIPAGLMEAVYLWDNFRDDKIKESVEKIAENVYQQFIKVLKNIDWLDDIAKVNFLAKAENVTRKIAYPDESMDKLIIEETYKGLEIFQDNYLLSSLMVDRMNREILFKNLGKSMFFLNPPTVMIVNAFYYKLSNKISIPAGILQGIFFDRYQPNYMNYGAIGGIIGHELTHSFDNYNYNWDDYPFDYYDWWSAAMNETYFKKEQCLIEQYNNYTVNETGNKLDGKKTVNENMADNGGLGLSYFAYKDWLEKNGPEAKLAGLEWTNEQMFWISAAQAECSKYYYSEMKDRLENEEHTLGEFRVIGAFSNSKEFSKDFHCPVGSKMNPINKCTVW